jgi:Tfp pilus assembly protein PilF
MGIMAEARIDPQEVQGKAVRRILGQEVEPGFQPVAAGLRAVLGALVFLLMLIALAPRASFAEDLEAMVARGIDLHDEGKYDEAIAIYREVLRQDPKNDHALYEMAFSFSTSKNLGECVRTAEMGVRTARHYRPEFFNLQGICLDYSGDPTAAVKTFNRGLKEFRRHPELSFSLAITEMKMGDLERARDHLKTSIEGRPRHASSHYHLSQVYAESGYDIPALLAALRFLSIEPHGGRAARAAGHVRDQIGLGISIGPDNSVNLAIDANAIGRMARKDEGDFTRIPLLLGVASAVQHMKRGPGQTEIDRLAGQLEAFLSVLNDYAPWGKARAFANRTYVPFLASIAKAELSVPFAYRALGSLELPGCADWISAHADEMKRLEAFLERDGSGGGN